MDHSTVLLSGHVYCARGEYEYWRKIKNSLLFSCVLYLYVIHLERSRKNSQYVFNNTSMICAAMFSVSMISCGKYFDALWGTIDWVIYLYICTTDLKSHLDVWILSRCHQRQNVRSVNNFESDFSRKMHIFVRLITILVLSGYFDTEFCSQFLSSCAI